MSLHASLKIGGKIKKKRNVMKRFERIDVLLKEKRIAEEQVFALPKTKPVE
ncbi:MAG: small basic protein [Victivallaceae bacterium]|jgi:small basic protein (TIGR04137 family)|nr:small basic protein [Victivallaceae bacterium]NLK82643.1 small basic protein [Lentisphaerota bacterium]MDD3116121.1 small basic protein [Victivallaceae bacterium]MDD3702875.1 small basic protein [Victivallaceae bacterium]MDD4318048.1 small basic protein [Victivallaceae bacterium]